MKARCLLAAGLDPKKFQPLLVESIGGHPADHEKLGTVCVPVSPEVVLEDRAKTKDEIALSILHAGRPESAPEIPPIYSGVVGDADKPLNEDTDAMRWAGEFMQAAQFIWERGQKIDKATMLGWFSNAIMCGFDESGRRYAKAAADARAEIERMQALNVQTFRTCEAELSRQNFAAIMWAILSFLAGVVATIGTLYGLAIFHR